MTNDHENIWTLRSNGKRFDLLEPKPEQVDFTDIAHSLANINRWSGITEPAISVAWHTLMCVKIAKWKGYDSVIPWLLLHDAHEAYIGDIPTPVMHAIHALCAPDAKPITRLKERLDAVIYKKAGLDLEALNSADLAWILSTIKEIDTICLMTERRDYLPSSTEPWPEALLSVEPFKRRLLIPEGPFTVEDELLMHFEIHLPFFTGIPHAFGALPRAVNAG